VVLAGQLIPSSSGTEIANTTGTDFGHVRRDVLCGPGQVNVDFSIIKHFPFREYRNIDWSVDGRAIALIALASIRFVE